MARAAVQLQTDVACAARDDGWAPLGAVGNLIAKVQSSFDSRNYGFKKLSDLMRNQKFVEVKSVEGADGAAPHVYVRLKDRKA